MSSESAAESVDFCMALVAFSASVSWSPNSSTAAATAVMATVMPSSHGTVALIDRPSVETASLTALNADTATYNPPATRAIVTIRSCVSPSRLLNQSNTPDTMPSSLPITGSNAPPICSCISAHWIFMRASLPSSVSAHAAACPFTCSLSRCVAVAKSSDFSPASFSPGTSFASAVVLPLCAFAIAVAAVSSEMPFARARSIDKPIRSCASDTSFVADVSVAIAGRSSSSATPVARWVLSIQSSTDAT